MKKILLFAATISLSFAAQNSFGQSFELTEANGTAISNGGSLEVWGEVNDLVEAHVYVKNTSSADKDVLVRRMVVSELANTINYFCWEQCYSPSVSLAPTPLTISSGATAQDFIGDYMPGTEVGKTTIRYSFFDEDNPSDSVWVEINYHGTPLGLGAFDQDKNSISQPMPNPANAVTTFEYNLNSSVQEASLVLYNMLGEKVREVALEKGTSVAKVYTESIDAGVYFYSFVVNSEVISTSRLVVTH